MYQIYINNTQLPAPQQWDESYTEVETINQTEDGHDQISQVRNNKLNVSASFNCSSYWYRLFHHYAMSRSVTLRRFDPMEGGMTDRTMYIRGFNASYQLYSDKLGGTYGAWVVTFTMTEF